MSQPEAMCHKGTPQSSQMIWMEDRIRELEDQLAAVEASNKNLKSCYVKTMRSLDRKTVDCIEARKLAEEYRDTLRSINLHCPGADELPWEVEK
jgi:hypothetical protein